MPDEKEIKLDPMKEVVTAGNILEILKRAAAAQGIQTPIGPSKLQIGVAEQNGQVIVNFGRQVQVLSLDPLEALKFCKTIYDVVKNLKRPFDGHKTAEDPKEVDKPE